MADELARHGYRVSYGTLYPILHRMFDEGLLEREAVHEGNRIRKYYTATAEGRQVLAQVQRLVSELYSELVVGEEREHE